jgi:sulfite exporter TauE/SafE
VCSSDLLPCGLVYIALAGSFAATGILESALFMAAFGTGMVVLYQSYRQATLLSGKPSWRLIVLVMKW